MGDGLALKLVGRPPQAGAWAAFCDFDGTITQRDTHDVLMEAFVPPRIQSELYRRFRSGEASLWQLLDESLVATGVSLEVAKAHLLATVPVDPHFGAFVAWCQAQGIPVAIVSAGLHEVIEAFLMREGLPSLPVVANRAIVHPSGFGLRPMEQSCPTGVDKAKLLWGAKDLGWRTAFVGDGVSDRLGVPAASRCYAKWGLANWCAREGHAHVPIKGFHEVQADLEQSQSSIQHGV